MKHVALFLILLLPAVAGHGVGEDNTETSHESGTDNARRDRFLAPFDGKHGWYWRNDSSQTTEVVLELAGTYILLT